MSNPKSKETDGLKGSDVLLVATNPNLKGNDNLVVASNNDGHQHKWKGKVVPQAKGAIHHETPTKVSMSLALETTELDTGLHDD
ncbi:hypothetical protein ACH5RR_001186 [Cinchona calisaya]|uniref:Uncharacterized protein n=1 Tax=Cinchona calisaya TaxID=153742 RepID=A0ABD3B2R3_9GENT